jgi:hypothetical protein
MNEDPYGEGWVVKLRGDDLRREQRRLRRGERARVWFGHEVDRLISALVGDEEVVALADGGRLVDELHSHVDPATWDRLKHDFFEVECG